MTPQTSTEPTGYAVLLRGVNVGGHARVPMPELRAALEERGYGGVRTYLNSGNAVLTADGPGDASSGSTPSGSTPPGEASSGEAVLGIAVEDVVEQRFGFRVACLVRSAAYLRAVIDANPYADLAATDGKLVHATFLSAAPDPDRLAAVPPESFPPDAYALGDRVVYLSVPHGIGRSKLAEALARPAVLKGVTATTRNWNTVLKLAELTGA